MQAWLEALEAFSAALVAALLLATVYFRQLRRIGQRTDAGSDHGVPSVGFLHPNAGGGGGGERVLWVALRTLLRADRRSGIRRQYTLYTRRYPASDELVAASTTMDRDRRDDEHLLQLVEQQFAIPRADFDLDRLKVVYMTRSWLLEPKYYPRLTLILQSLIGGFAAFLDVATRGATDVVIDTVGVPFSYAFLSIMCGCTIATYTHYPVISTDMMGVVASRSASFNNAGAIARNPLLSTLKLKYYQVFATLYRWFGGNFASVVMTNSSWTDDHIRFMWRRRDTSVVFPPCNVARFAKASLEPDQRRNLIVSVGQFRPEKNHTLQVEAFHAALTGGLIPADSRLVLVGGARDDGDRARVAALQQLVRERGLAASVDIEVSVPQPRVLELLAQATVGLHTMRDEHFGIVVAEYMASGCVAVAHDSAGPKRDIVQDGATGFLRDTEGGFAEALGKAFALRKDAAAWRAFTGRARESSARFSDQYFSQSFAARVAPVLALTLMADEDDDGVKLCC